MTGPTASRGERPLSATEPLGLLLIPVLGASLVFACWTLAYHACLLASLPARAIWLPFGLLLTAGALPALRKLRLPSDWSFGGGALLATIALALVLAFASLFIAFHIPDDVNYFHRALFQLDRQDSPFILTQTGYNEEGLPYLSMAHALTAHEHFVAMVADTLGLDPLLFYHKTAGALGYVLFVFVYVLLFRQLGLAPKQAVLAFLLALGFCLLDLRIPGRTHANALVYMYEGKFLMLAVGIPVTLLTALRHAEAPSPGRLAWVAVVAVAAVGLTGSAIFLIPALLAGVGLAWFLVSDRSLEDLAQAACLVLASGYGLAIGAGGLLGFLPTPEDTDVVSNFPAEWWRNFALILKHPTVLVRDLVFLCAAPLLALDRARGRFLVLLSLSLLLVYANPLMGPLWIEVVTPGAYWRLWFLLPVILCAGLMGEWTLRTVRAQWRHRVVVVATLALALLPPVVAHRQARAGLSLLRERVPLGPIGEVRLPADPLRFARSAAPLLRGRSILTAKEVFPTLALIAPELRFEAGRFTRHTFANAGRPAEGEQRDRAMTAITLCEQDPDARAALQTSLDRGVDALVLGRCFQEPAHRSSRETLHRQLGPGWSHALEEGGYTLLLRSSGPASATRPRARSGSGRDPTKPRAGYAPSLRERQSWRSPS